VAYYALGTRALKQGSDKLGLRQLYYYYWDGASFFLFASALRILEAISEVALGSLNFARFSAFPPTVVE
jgi:asparagine synthetase B (glutamine-hydrolysing)